MSDNKRLLLLTSTLLEVIQEQNDTIDDIEAHAESLQRTVEHLEGDVSHLERENMRIMHLEYDVSDLRQRNEGLMKEARAAKEDEKVHVLTNRVKALEGNLELTFWAINYMVLEGHTLLQDGNKIACIKAVRDFTTDKFGREAGFGLLEAKNFVEAYAAGSFAHHVEFYTKVYKPMMIQKNTLEYKQEGAKLPCNDADCESCNP